MDQDKMIILSDLQIKNLKVFLSRVDLKGSEVLEFAVILQSINEAETYPNEVGGKDE